MGMVPGAFEPLARRHCARLISAASRLPAGVAAEVGDGGAGGLGGYRPGLVSFPAPGFFQCQRYRRRAGPAAVRDCRGATAGRATRAC